MLSVSKCQIDGYDCDFLLTYFFLSQSCFEYEHNFLFNDHYNHQIRLAVQEVQMLSDVANNTSSCLWSETMNKLCKMFSVQSVTERSLTFTTVSVIDAQKNDTILSSTHIMSLSFSKKFFF